MKNTGYEYNSVTVSEALEIIAQGPFQMISMIILGLCYSAFAMQIYACLFLLLPPEQDWSGFASMINASFAFGLCLGSILVGGICDKFGRKRTIVTSLYLTGMFGLSCTFTDSILLLCIVRFLIGMSCSSMLVVYVMCYEILAPSQRPFILTTFLIFWTFGGVFEGALGWALITEFGWRYWVAATSAPQLAMWVICFHFLENSPRFLYSVGKWSEAESLLQDIAQSNGIVHPIRLNIPDMPKGSLDFVDRYKLVLSNRLTIPLTVIWACVSYFYFAIVLLASTAEEGMQYSFSTTFLSTLSEGIAPIVIGMVVHKWTLKNLISSAIIAASLKTVFLIVTWSSAMSSMILMGMRILILSSLDALMLYTSLAFPTSVRGSALGITIASGQVGFLIAIFVTRTGTFFTSILCALSGFLASQMILKLPIDQGELEEPLNPNISSSDA